VLSSVIINTSCLVKIINYDQITFASFCNFYKSSSMSFTFTPPFFLVGSKVDITCTLEGYILRDYNSTYSIVAFLAFIMFGIVAILGVFNRRSQVITPGGLNLIVCKPVSTYRVTSTSPSLTSIFDANVAWGQSRSPANNWPVWLQSSSTATFY